MFSLLEFTLKQLEKERKKGREREREALYDCKCHFNWIKEGFKSVYYLRMRRRSKK